MNSTVLLHVQKRNDYEPDNHAIHTLKLFECFDEAIKYIQDQLDTCEIKLTEDDILHLKEGGSVWTWEWERRGNGDYYRILSRNEDTIEFNLCSCEYEKSRVLDYRIH